MSRHRAQSQSINILVLALLSLTSISALPTIAQTRYPGARALRVLVSRPSTSSCCVLYSLPLPTTNVHQDDKFDANGRDASKYKHESKEKGATRTSRTINNRRQLLKFIASSSALSLLSTSAGSNQALAAQTAGEAVRKSAANIPGYGQPDIYFPPSFIGKWRATRVIVASDDPFLSQLHMGLPVTISYDVRFITVDGDVKSNGGDQVIYDRQFNEASYYNAIKATADKQEGRVSPPSIQTITWSPFNPNVCTSNYSDGSMKEIKVTKRAAEMDAASGIISSSEYRRVTTTGAVSSGSFGGIPSISASRVLTKWKSDLVDGNQLVEGIEIVYSDGSIGGDPMAAGSFTGGSGGSKQPQMSSKSRLKLERIED